MSTITFDTQDLVRGLSASGLPASQAEAVVRAIVKSHDGLATRADLDRLESGLNARFTLLEAKFDKLQWMLTALIAIAAAHFAKQFF